SGEVDLPRNELMYYHFNQSAFMGLGDGQFNMGSIFLTGMGGLIQKHNERALQWLARAVEGGHAAAHYTLGTLHLNGVEGAAKDCSLAVTLFKQPTVSGLSANKRMITHANNALAPPP